MPRRPLPSAAAAWRLLAAAVMALCICSPLHAKSGPPALVGYVPVFRGMDEALKRADLSHYTHLMLAFANPVPSGALVARESMTCMPGGSAGMVSSAALRKLVAKAHKAGSKVLVSVGGGVIPPCSGDWAELLRPGSRDKVVRQLIALVDEHDLDGLDIDIEGVILTKIDQAGNYTPFIASLSQALKARGKLLTCATGSYEGGMVPKSSIPYFDLIGVMAYDSIGPTWGPAGSEHSPIEQAQRDLQLWIDRGASPERIVLGVPYYGYGFGSFKPTYAFRDIRAEFGKTALEKDVIGSRCAGCSYITYNGLPTLRKKAELARQRAGGLMVWEIAQDTDDHLLVRTLKKAWEDAGCKGKRRGRRSSCASQ